MSSLAFEGVQLLSTLPIQSQQHIYSMRYRLFFKTLRLLLFPCPNIISMISKFSKFSTRALIICIVLLMVSWTLLKIG